MVLLRFADLGKAFGGQQVIAGASGEVRAGEVVLLRGGNGAGKTTLLNLLGGALAPDHGTVQLAAATTQSPPHGIGGSAAAARAGVARLWQDSRLFASLDALDNLAVADHRHPGLSPLRALLQPRHVQRHEAALRAGCTARLAALGLADYARRSGAALSLGQARRVALARTQLAGARLLLLDEPLAGLDDAARTQVVEQLRRRVVDDGLALVIVEHASNAQPLLPLVTRVWTLADGRLSTAPVSAPAATHDDDAGARLPALLAARQAPRYRREVALPGGATLDILGSRDAPGRPLLMLQALRVARDGQALTGGDAGITLALHEGETAVLQAPNGWGKSSLLETLAGLLPAAGGRVLRDADTTGTTTGEQRSTPIDITCSPAHERVAHGLALLRSREHGFDHLTVRETLQLGGITTLPDLLAPLGPRRVADLSGGERQLLALLGVLQRPTARVRLLDEPFSGLDAARRATVLREHWRDDGATLIALPGTR
jgi:ABC-type branched-subunit amino acid transport system ATPase component